MTNERLMGALLVIFIIAASGYFAFTKFKQEVGSVSASPSPSPQTLDFSLLQTPAPTVWPTTQPAAQQQSQPTQVPAPQPSGLPLEKVKKLDRFPGILKPEVLDNKKAVITTGKGTIQIQIFPDVPQTASNFLLLAANGFYDSLTFHRVVPGFVIQGGDPLGNGTGGPGYTFADEQVTREYKKGIVAMANAGPNTNGSQFFILLEDHPELPKSYTIFGQVITGMDVVEKIMQGDVMVKVVVQNLQ